MPEGLRRRYSRPSVSGTWLSTKTTRNWLVERKGCVEEKQRVVPCNRIRCFDIRFANHSQVVQACALMPNWLNTNSIRSRLHWIISKKYLVVGALARIDRTFWFAPRSPSDDYFPRFRSSVGFPTGNVGKETVPVFGRGNVKRTLGNRPLQNSTLLGHLLFFAAGIRVFGTCWSESRFPRWGSGWNPSARFAGSLILFKHEVDRFTSMALINETNGQFKNAYKYGQNEGLKIQSVDGIFGEVQKNNKSQFVPRADEF